MSYVIRPASEDDCVQVARRLRGDDRREIEAFSGREPEHALLDGWWDSIDCRAFEINGELCGVYGVAPTPNPDLGIIWLLGTDGIDRGWRTFLRHSRSELASFHQYYPALFNYVDARNSLHVRWLRWLGVTFINRHPCFGVEGREFYEFIHV